MKAMITLGTPDFGAIALVADAQVRQYHILPMLLTKCEADVSARGEKGR
ncbi:MULTISPECIES: hypothetical protein [unclassified Bradyrhizobium]|nr:MULTISPECIES: hypothetical protein [unclassified Bradyrhizobium]